MNKNYLVNDGVIKLVDFVSVSSKGKKSINAKNSYLLALAVKALSQKSIGCNFVVDTEYKQDTVRLTNKTVCHNSRYDKNSNTINTKDLVNVLNLVNLFLEDRQLLCRKNNSQNLIIQIVRPEAALVIGKSLFKRVKNASIVTTVECFDLVTNEVTEEDEKTRQGLALFTEDDKRQALENFKTCDNVLELDGKKIVFTDFLKLTLKDLEEIKNNKKSEKTA